MLPGHLFCHCVVRRFSLLTFASLGVLYAACTNAGSSAGPLCSEYLSCLSTAAPSELPTALQVYGRDGSCAVNLASATCEQSCEQALFQLKQRPELDGCIPASRRGPDMSIDPTALDLWDFGVKAMYYTGPRRDPELTGVDPGTGQWRCLRDDANPDPPAAIRRMFEPNDLPESTIVLGAPILDPLPTYMGANFEICPDPSNPWQPDLDAFKLRLTIPSNIKIEVLYSIETGDLDVGVFRAPAMAGDKPARVVVDLTARDNACVAIPMMPAGTYYVVIRGTRGLDDPTAYSMNRYRLRLAAYSDGVFTPCP